MHHHLPERRTEPEPAEAESAASVAEKPSTKASLIAAGRSRQGWLRSCAATFSEYGERPSPVCAVAERPAVYDTDARGFSAMAPASWFQG